MNFQDFRRQRAKQVAMMAANGYNDGDSTRNGEFFTLDALAPYFDLFVDIGSNQGIFIDRLNQSLSHFILAFEPNPYLTDLLLEKISRGTLVQKALSNRQGAGQLNIYKDNTTSSLLKRDDLMPHFTESCEPVKIEIDLLDNYFPLIRKFSSKGIFIKIDAEGAEFPILEGASAVLQKISSVFLMFEYSAAWRQGGHTLKQAFHLLDELGYKIYRVTPFGLESLRLYTPHMDNSDYCNYFAVKGSAISDIFDCDLLPSTTHVLNEFHLFSIKD